jgi:hypothetical protein
MPVGQFRLSYRRFPLCVLYLGWAILRAGILLVLSIHFTIAAYRMRVARVSHCRFRIVFPSSKCDLTVRCYCAVWRSLFIILCSCSGVLA